jgi:phosphoribosylformimino-5-aminoimidazole carboxamide ribotide isomerase
VPVIASGGLNDLEDVKRLCELESEGVTGCVAGRAIYEGKLDFAAAVKLASGEA